MGIIGWIIIGGAAGWIAGQLMGGKSYGILGNILLGIVGGTVGGWVFSLIGLYARDSWIGGLVTSIAGAVLLIWIVRKVRKE